MPAVLVKLGIDADHPFEMQRDLQHLRAWRLSMARISGRIGLSVITLAVAGALAAMWAGIVQIMNQGAGT